MNVQCSSILSFNHTAVSKCVAMQSFFLSLQCVVFRFLECTPKLDGCNWSTTASDTIKSFLNQLVAANGLFKIRLGLTVLITGILISPSFEIGPLEKQSSCNLLDIVAGKSLLELLLKVTRNVSNELMISEAIARNTLH